MTPIRIRTRIESDTLHLPALRPLIGKDVEIVVCEEPRRSPATKADWDRFFAEHPGDLVDPSVIEDYRRFDAEHNVAWTNDPR